MVDSYNAYKWNFGDGSAINTEVLPTHDFVALAGQPVDVSLEVETINGCTNDSLQRISLPDFASLYELTVLGISVYPNPTSDVVYIDNRSGKRFQYSLSNLAGEIITSKTLRGRQGSIDLSSLPQGIYILSGYVDASNKTSIQLVRNNC